MKLPLPDVDVATGFTGARWVCVRGLRAPRWPLDLHLHPVELGSQLRSSMFKLPFWIAVVAAKPNRSRSYIVLSMRYSD